MSEKRESNNLRKVIISTIIFIIIISVGTIVYTKCTSRNQVGVKAVAYNEKGKVENQNNIKKILDNKNSIVKNSNVTQEGKKYTYDASEINKILSKWQSHVDGHKIAFLTFDDGPSVIVTPKILKILKDNNAHATFSLIGKEIEQSNESKDLVKQEVEEGHAIGNHTYSHNYDILYPGRTVSVTNYMNEVDRTNEILKGILGSDFHTRVIRMPGGHMSWRGTKAIDNVFNQQGYVYVDWNDDDEDSIRGTKNSEQIFEKVKKYDCGQDRLVVIMHDTKESVVDALPKIIQYLKAQGYEFKTLS